MWNPKYFQVITTNRVGMTSAEVAEPVLREAAEAAPARGGC